MYLLNMYLVLFFLIIYFYISLTNTYLVKWI